MAGLGSSLRCCLTSPATKSFKQDGAAPPLPPLQLQLSSADDDVLDLLPAGQSKIKAAASVASKDAPQQGEECAEQIAAYLAQPLQLSPPTLFSMPGTLLDVLSMPPAAGAEDVGAAPSGDVGAAHDDSSSCHSLGRQVAQILAGLQPVSPTALEHSALLPIAGTDASPDCAAGTCEVATLPAEAAAGPQAVVPHAALLEASLGTAAVGAAHASASAIAIAAAAEGVEAPHPPPFLRASSSGSSRQTSCHASGHSPRRSSGSVSWDAEASKRYSVSGSVSPALDTIRESTSQLDASFLPAGSAGRGLPAAAPPCWEGCSAGSGAGWDPDQDPGADTDAGPEAEAASEIEAQTEGEAEAQADAGVQAEAEGAKVGAETEEEVDAVAAAGSSISSSRSSTSGGNRTANPSPLAGCGSAGPSSFEPLQGEPFPLAGIQALLQGGSRPLTEAGSMDRGAGAAGATSTTTSGAPSSSHATVRGSEAQASAFSEPLQAEPSLLADVQALLQGGSSPGPLLPDAAAGISAGPTGTSGATHCFTDTAENPAAAHSQGGAATGAESPTPAAPALLQQLLQPPAKHPRPCVGTTTADLEAAVAELLGSPMPVLGPTTAAGMGAAAGPAAGAGSGAAAVAAAASPDGGAFCGTSSLSAAPTQAHRPAPRPSPGPAPAGPSRGPHTGGSSTGRPVATGAAEAVPASRSGASPAWGCCKLEWGRAEDEGAEAEGPLPAMYARQVRERQQAEKRNAQLRQQQEQEHLAGCTFKPALLAAAGHAGAHGRPSSAPSGGRGPSGCGVYERQVGQRLQAQQRNEWIRQQREQEALAECTFRPAVDPRSAALFQAGVRYSGGGAIVAGGGSARAGSRAGASLAASMDTAVRQQLELLHSAGLNASAAAAVLCTTLSGHLGAPAGSCSSGAPVPPAVPQSKEEYGQQDQEGTSVPGSEGTQDRVSALLAGMAVGAGLQAQAEAAPVPHAVQPEAEPTSTNTSHGQPAGDALPTKLAELAGAALPQDLSPGPGPSGSPPPAHIPQPQLRHLPVSAAGPGGDGRGCVQLTGSLSPVKACDRLYAHARDLQGRKREAREHQDQKLREEALARSPKPRPFPSAQHSHGPSPPLSRRSPPPTRPASALSPGWAARAAAWKLQEAQAEQGQGQGQGQARSPAYWQRFGLDPQPDFSGFLDRQQKFAQVLERKLERKRQLSVPAQRGATLSPGTQRILQRRKSACLGGLGAPEARQQKDGKVEGGEGQGLSGLARRPLSAGSAVCASIARGLAGVLELAGMPASGLPATSGEQEEGVRDEATLTYSPAEGASEGMYSAASDSWQPTTAAGGGGPLQHSPYLAHCTFRPTITERAAARPGRSPEQLHGEWKKRQDKLELKRRLAEEAAVAACTFSPDITPASGSSAKYGSARPRINMQDLEGYMQDLRQRQEAKQAAAAAAAKAREEEEAAECTFHPRLVGAPASAGQHRSSRQPSGQARPPTSHTNGTASSYTPDHSNSEPSTGKGAGSGSTSPGRPADVLAQVHALLAGAGGANPERGTSNAAATATARARLPTAQLASPTAGSAQPATAVEPAVLPRPGSLGSRSGSKQAARAAAAAAEAAAAPAAAAVPLPRAVSFAASPGPPNTRPASAAFVGAGGGGGGGSIGGFDTYLARVAQEMQKLQGQAEASGLGLRGCD